ncbi:ankyrin repeat-containing domain protein [Chaetomium sp. MPI-CAGE-AT-0009]|nr:ankyrin repeat-containing domain protein [Chaetomium sp. MPI-CAGE-AT-0009]
MADPLSIIGTAIGAFQFFKDLKDLGDKYAGAPGAVKDFQDECQITLDSLKVIEQVLKDTPDIVSKSATGQSLWTKCAEAADRVKSLVRSFAAELPKVKNKKKNKLGRWDKLTFIWDADYFNERMTAIRFQRQILEDMKSNVPMHQLNVILNNGLLGVNGLAPPGAKEPRTVKSDSNLQEALVSQLLEAIRADKVAEVKDIFSNGLSPDIVLNENQDTALHIAAAEGKPKIVDLLLGTEIPSRANINALNKNWETPLHQALNFDHANTSHEIMRHQPNIHLANSKMVTPLHLAAERCLRSEVQHLLSAGAHVNAMDNHGLTPLFYATTPRDAKHKSREPDLDIINILLGAEKPASLEQASFRSRTTVIHSAAANGKCKVLELMLPRASKETLNAQTNDNHKSKRATALYLAVINKHKTSVDTLLKFGADPNISCTPGGPAPTALWAALRMDRLDIAEAVLKAGADANATGPDGETPIHYVVSTRTGKTKEAITLLASHGADLNARAPKTSESPLDTAARTGRLDVVKSLLQQKAAGGGADINGGATAGATHRTPVMHAADAGKLSVLYHLCVAKADWKRATADDAAETAFVLAAGGGRLCCASYLLGRGAKMDQAAGGGYTALHYAARAGRLDAVKWLVVTGADWRKKATAEREGFKSAGTALEVARAHGKEKVVEYLEKLKE